MKPPRLMYKRGDECSFNGRISTLRDSLCKLFLLRSVTASWRRAADMKVSGRAKRTDLTPRSICSGSTVGVANWMVINGMEAPINTFVSRLVKDTEVMGGEAESRQRASE